MSKFPLGMQMRTPSRLSLLYASIVGLNLLVISLVGIILTKFHGHSRERITVVSKNLAKSFEEMTFDMISAVDVQLQSAAKQLSQSISKGNGDEHTLTQIVVSHQLKIQETASLRASDAQGKPLCGTSILPSSVDLSEHAHFTVHRDRPEAGLFIGSPIIERTSNEWVWVFSRRLNKAEGAFAGVIYAAIPVSVINRKYQVFNLEPNNIVVLRNQDDHLIVRHISPNHFTPPEHDTGLTAAFKQALLVNPNEGTYETVGPNFDHNKRLHSYFRNPKYGFLLTVGISNQSVFAVWKNMMMVSTLFGLVFVALSVIFAQLLGKAWAQQAATLKLVEQSKNELAQIAYHDALTQLPNRLMLQDRLKQAMAQAKRRNQLIAALFIDLDNFKNVNDACGHDVGDRLLVDAADTLRLILREGDTLARMGGDEFVVVLVDLPNKESAYLLAERLLASIGSITIMNCPQPITASIGISFFPQAHEVDADQLVRQADHAMYQAKNSGKNRSLTFDGDQEMYARLRRRLRTAIQEGEFVLYYQPQKNFAKGEIYGAEALVRWQHPDDGLLAPSEFLQYILGSELEIEFGDWVLDSALRQLSIWNAAGSSLTVSINISAGYLLRADFVERLNQALALYPEVPPNNLGLEILETTAIADIVHATNVLLHCRELDIKISLDDFGTGYSSFAHLKSLPINQLKIDRSFILDMTCDPFSLRIVSTMIDLARNFGLEVIAEGVESADHISLLAELGCHRMQGYAIVRPMPAEHVLDWITADSQKTTCTNSNSLQE